jgi:sortase A
MLQRISPKSLLFACKTAVFVLGFTFLSWTLGRPAGSTRQFVPVAAITPTSPPAMLSAMFESTPTAAALPTETPLPSKALGAWLEDTMLLLPDGFPAAMSTGVPDVGDTPVAPPAPAAPAAATATVAHPPAITPGPLSTVLSKAITNGASQLVPTATATATPRPDTPTAVPPTATPKPDGTPILPTGAKYGDHNPNVPGRIVRVAAPSIKLDTKVYEVYGVKGVWEVADYAAGHHYNSKNPGDGGNIVLSGHNNWRGEVFRDLANLKPGDEIRVWTQAGKEYVYKVRKIDKLKEVGVSYAQRVKNAQVLNDTPQEQLTLISCWPYTTFTHRLVVTADPVSK